MYQALGLNTSDLQLGAEFITDPALAEFTCLAKRARAAFKGQVPGPPCPRYAYTDAQRSAGVGLHRSLEPMRVATWVRENPIASAAIGLGTVGLLVGIGYYLGSK